MNFICVRIDKSQIFVAATQADSELVVEAASCAFQQLTNPYQFGAELNSFVAVIRVINQPLLNYIAFAQASRWQASHA